jgi:curved DNA-binding protein CbpA
VHEWWVPSLRLGGSVEEIRAAWRALVQRWHPDRAQGDAAVAEATRRVAAINAAWRVLQGG